MKAMILAAGLGTRLRPLTNHIPKALIPINQKPLIEHVITRLIKFGVTEFIINLHHYPEQIKEFIRSKNDFGIRIHYSPEEKLLDTGGGLKNAAWFFDDDQPFILHNVDILSTIDLTAMLKQHHQEHNLVTLAVKRRETSRYLLFDDKNNLCGWRSVKDDRTIWCGEPIETISEYGFCGIHIISPQLFEVMEETGVFSIIKCYLRLAGQGEKIKAFTADRYEWYDLGKKEILAHFKQKIETAF